MRNITKYVKKLIKYLKDKPEKAEVLLTHLVSELDNKNTLINLYTYLKYRLGK